MSTDATDATFHDVVISSTRPVIVDFWAPWCGPCRAISPILDAIADEHPEVSVVKVNVDENPGTAATFGITSIPAVYIFVDGSIAKRIQGAKPKPALLAGLAPWLAS